MKPTRQILILVLSCLLWADRLSAQPRLPSHTGAAATGSDGGWSSIPWVILGGIILYSLLALIFWLFSHAATLWEKLFSAWRRFLNFLGK